VGYAWLVFVGSTGNGGPSDLRDFAEDSWLSWISIWYVIPWKEPPSAIGANAHMPVSGQDAVNERIQCLLEGRKLDESASARFSVVGVCFSFGGLCIVGGS